jgi:hypothetical protein
VGAHIERQLAQRLAMGQVVQHAGGGQDQRGAAGAPDQQQREGERCIDVDGRAAPVTAERDREEGRHQHQHAEDGHRGQILPQAVEIDGGPEQAKHHQADRRDDDHVRPEPAHHRASLS